MTHRDHSFHRRAGVRCAIATSLLLCAPFLTGCGGEEEEVVVAPVAPPPPPPPPKPSVTTIADLMAQLNIDPRVVLPEDKAPDNDVDRKAILTFFDAFARGNANDVRSLIAMTDQIELDDLVKTGEWKAVTSDIEKIEIQTGASPYNQKCALAVFHVMGSFQPQLWYYQAQDDAAAEFEAAPAPPGIINQLHGDWIATWHKILADEIALAEKPDEDIILPRKSLDPNDPNAAAAGPSAGGRGGGGGGLRRPGGAPIAPPGPRGPGPGGR